MIPNVSNALAWLEYNPQALKGIRRGIEREALRINVDGSLATTFHPKALGSALTHKYITTDFAEALLEFVTPVNDDIDRTLTILRDIHRYVIRHLGEERLWPMSMPFFVNNHHQPIVLAQYGCSNIGRMKTLYRHGLKNRYSALMQMISGIHYNFSLPLTFWKTYSGVTDELSGQKIISNGYLQLIRNYYRFGWIIPYFFGASQGVTRSFLRGRTTNLRFKKGPSDLMYLPYSTSLRLGDIGYMNHLQNQLDITFNDLDEYIFSLKQAMERPSIDYQKIGLQKDGRYLQLNTNMLQTENELYTPIRPKRVTQGNESTLDALVRGGIQYIEVRSLDINPFSSIGIDEEQVRFLDLFLVWCTLAKAPIMNSKELLLTRINWNRVILEGLKPGLMLFINHYGDQQSLASIGKLLFKDLRRLAKILDQNDSGNMSYQKVCDKLVKALDCPNLTLSSRFLNKLIQHGMGKLGLILANDYRQTLLKEPLQVMSTAEFNKEQLQSWCRQRALEETDILSFDDFLAKNKFPKF
ncbi:glutamate--cysteine ligase [Candidatus Curculioniphilus buchneri]|uniref:glutamate--cysteine ligase n=1 Tax=Candidatus Curculioniphilus buchneri TaxID=690594 RepID=UPI00376EBEE9